jgi:2-keto-3-deoxy-L-rhamnonate aldolase RhmA/NAD(P)-dependent dehydrogenase (short-subunit alcohol dehydrogenase family)
MKIISNPIRQKLAAGDCVGCHWVALGSPSVAEVMAQGQPDAMVFDLQHGLWTRETLEHGIGIVRGLTTPLCRVAENSPHAIGSALDAGAMGVIVPFVETAEQAEAAVVAAKYPPRGMRSFGNVRPIFDAASYVNEANANTFVAVMIETAKGVENAAEIAATPGVDMIFIGPFDLSLSLGTFPDFGPKHQDAILRVKAAAETAGKNAGIFTAHGMMAADRRAQGFQMVVLANDQDLLQGPSKAQVSRFAARDGEDLVDGRVALVTGTNRGIGSEIVRALLAGGAKKVYCAARDVTALRPLISEAPERLQALELDITDEARIAAAAKACGDVALLVNNAGINHNTPLFAIDDTANARREMEVNYFGTLNMCRAFIPILKANGGGAIVNMVSILAHANLPLMGSLCASKAALLSLTQALRAELKAQGTHVMAVLPGAVNTDMTKGFDIPKIAAAYVASTLMDGLSLRQEEVYPGDMATSIVYGMLNNPKETEWGLGTYLPPNAP